MNEQDTTKLWYGDWRDADGQRKVGAMSNAELSKALIETRGSQGGMAHFIRWEAAARLGALGQIGPQPPAWPS
jgi:hypothetical protein